jgi:ABC-type transport system involved in multi-copper enzyme maturation permease subunit
LTNADCLSILHFPMSVAIFISPIIERELRCGLRKGGARALRTKYALGCAWMTAVCLFAMSHANVARFGSTLHTFLFLLGLHIAFVQTPSLTAGLISRERHSRTLGLLFLAGLRPMEVFIGKLLGGAMLSFGNLLALAPFMAVPFLSGGLSFQLFTATVFCLPNVLFFALSITILGSVLCEDEGAALIVAAILGGVIAGLAPALYQANLFFSDTKSISAAWLLASPAYGPFMVFRNFAMGSPSEFWVNSSITLAWSCLALTIAGAILKRTWQDSPAADSGRDWRAGWRDWFHGTALWRREAARRWLDSHPFTWLALHDRSPERLAWCLVAGITALWLSAWAAWPSRWLSIPNFLITAVLLNAAVEWIAMYASGVRFAADRRSGALELLLTTPLTTEEIVEDQLEALRHRFQPVFWATLGLNLTMMLGGFFLRDWPDKSAWVYVAAWLPFLFWSWNRSFRSCLIPMWASLNCGRPAYAVWRAAGHYTVFAWMMILLNNMSYRHSLLSKFPSGSLAEIAFIASYTLLLCIFMMEQRSKVNAIGIRLRDEFRSIAERPVPEPSDTRMKRWKIEERFDGNESSKDIVLGPRWMSLIRRAARAKVNWSRRCR